MNGKKQPSVKSVTTKKYQNLLVLSAQHDLRVEDDVKTEDQRTQTRINQVSNLRKSQRVVAHLISVIDNPWVSREIRHVNRCLLVKNFLDACISIRGFVRPSVRYSILQSFRHTSAIFARNKGN